MLSNHASQPLDKVVKPELKNDILLKPSTTSRSLRVVVITNNDKKYEEFRSQLGDGYGMEVTQWKTDEKLNLRDEQTLSGLCADIMAGQQPSPHFILREETTLKSRKDGRDLTDVSIAELAKLTHENVVHTSSLTVYKPQWTGTGDKPSPQETKKLNGFSVREYEQRSYGYIKRNSGNLRSELGFGWDAIFVNGSVNLTNEEFFLRYGKKSARQHVISVFIETYLRYKALKSLEHHSLKLSRPIDFGDNHVSVAQFVRNETHMSNPYIAEWGIDKLRSAVINEGMFFKAAWSRPVKNYFSPPFSGLPLTEKKDEVEETIFMTHDMHHHLIPDLICDRELMLTEAEWSRETFYVYSGWRMMSEACTMIFADMLYADGLMKYGVDRRCVDSRIYPLFEAVKEVEAVKRGQSMLDPMQMQEEDKISFIKKLLFANVKYALLGDDSGWTDLISHDGQVREEHRKRLDAYKAHFGKFFIGDNAWTRANFDNMQKNRESLKEWINSVDRNTFRQANIPLISDVCRALTGRGLDANAYGGLVVSDYQQLIEPLFDYIFDTRIKPHLQQTRVVQDDDEVLQSRAFRRFLIGQTSLFSRYPTPFNMKDIRNKIFARLRDPAPFSRQEQDDIRLDLEEYIKGLEGARLMTYEEHLNAIDCTPVFPPVYISYAQMQKEYKSIESCVKQRITSYGRQETVVSNHASTLFGAPQQAEAESAVLLKQGVAL